ncbi:MAG TPA: ATP-binding protein, partial [Armatimonadota bacterium]|nr:ATP-binding protein [Armatimonadota bacterium]
GEVRAEVFHTDALSTRFPPAEAYAATASGLLAASISRFHHSYILWFRPEVVRTVKWGGDPRKPVEPAASGERLHPRKSFEMWKETVRDRSLPWRESEIETAGELRSAIVGIVLRRAEELAALSAELERSNKELEAFSYSVSHDLRAPFRHIVGYSELLRDLEGAALSEQGLRFLDTITESAQHAGTLVDNLLAFSRMGRTRIRPMPVDMTELVRELQGEFALQTPERKITWKLHPLPPAEGDLMMLRLAWHNLIGNAVKYTRTRPEAVIEIGGESTREEEIYFIRDNGIGFDMEYVDKLFGVFQRLHRAEDFEGTGIGLANVRRIIGRHGGRTWGEGVVDGGATFRFTLPRIKHREME